MRKKGRFVGLLVVCALAVAACSADVTQSEEYLALAAEVDDLTSSNVETADQLADTEGDLAEVEDEIETVRDELADAKERAEAAESMVEDLEADLEEATSRIAPYPQPIVDEFVDGCVEGDPSMEDACVCAIDQIQQEVPFDEFFLLVLAFEGVELDPVTGAPDASLFQIDGAEIFLDALLDCMFMTDV